MKSGNVARRFVCVFAGLLAMTYSAPQILAQKSDAPSVGAQSKVTGLVEVVRKATERFRDVSVAEGEEYQLLFGCVSGPDSGAMGLHYVNVEKAFDGVLDPESPDILIYEAQPNGRLKLIGADFIIFAAKWHETHPANETPQIMGQLLHLFESPNRFGLDAFYTLHVWAWKESPAGAFVNWHPNVSCEHFAPPE
jgi:hypothetical protein